MTAMIPALAGASLIYGPGLIESGMTVDPAVLVADNDAIDFIRHTARGVPTDDQSMMIEEIIARGPETEWISSASTLKGVRNLSAPKFMDRRSREEWEQAGSQGAYEVARDEARRVLAEHEVDALPDDVERQLTRIVAEADARFVGSATHG